MPTRIEQAAQTLNSWLQAAADNKEHPPSIEPIVGEGDMYQLSGASTAGGGLTLRYAKGKRTYSCEIDMAEDIHSISASAIKFSSDGEAGSIKRGKKLK